MPNPAAISNTEGGRGRHILRNWITESKAICICISDRYYQSNCHKDLLSYIFTNQRLPTMIGEKYPFCVLIIFISYYEWSWEYFRMFENHFFFFFCELSLYFAYFSLASGLLADFWKHFIWEISPLLCELSFCTFILCFGLYLFWFLLLRFILRMVKCVDLKSTV